MKASIIGAGARVVVVLTCLLAMQIWAAGQATKEKCLVPGRVDQLIKQVSENADAPENAALSKEFVDLGTRLLTAGRQAVPAVAEGKPDESLEALKVEVRRRVCGHLNKFGFPTVSAVKPEGVNAFMYMISKALPLEMQLELYPVVSEAYRRELLERDEFLASFFDRLQLAVTGKQLFGSQAFVRDGFLVLAPIDRPDLVEQRRKEFKMESLRSYERFLEASYKMPLIRSVQAPVAPQSATAVKAETAAAPPSGSIPLGPESGEEEVIKISTALVTLDVVVAEPAGTPVAPLDKNDFRVFENGKPAEIETFARADAPFDIVLLLDLSGSTADKSSLIRKSTRRFIEMKRPVDRLAVVSFSDTQQVHSGLESDPKKLLDSVKDLDGGGGSMVWDSIKYAQDMLERNGEKGRRQAIVIMSDGVDNSLVFQARTGSKISFADLAESVQRGNAAIFPIFLDTQPSNSNVFSKRTYVHARQTLAYLAEQSAGKMYTAARLEDVAGLYDRVMNDVGTVYTLGFTPAEEIKSGGWRPVKVEIPSRPNLRIWHRPGYFPRPSGSR